MVNASTSSAVNKVLGILDIIIRKAVNFEIDKIKETVNGIKYSETTGTLAPIAGTIQTSATK
ncbi:variable large family protein [Borrelia recurrentis]|uniref:variable large family protein n=1 Tax=Borrelia recurrentis TaxID=44449 RepID=UPI00366F1490